ncbi:MAG: DUF6702 family protein [Pseudomonadota bacterium]
MAATAHPLRLSLSEIEYRAEQSLLTISLRLFLTDVNEALVFDPNSAALAFCQPNESPNAVPLLLSYLYDYFYVKANGERVDLRIKSKTLSGEGANQALVLLIESEQAPPLRSLEIHNTVFTDLFFDQSNIVYLDVDGELKSFMLNKETPALRFSY